MAPAIAQAIALDVDLVGILNVTPDSFSDGGRYVQPRAALAQGRALAADGAALIDVGGESTRPGATALDEETELARLTPVVQALVADGIAVSVDTRRARVMRRMLALGAVMINDVSGLTHDPQAASVLADADCRVVVMHARGTPQTMARLCQYQDVVTDVIAELSARIEHALRAGIAARRLVIDPGIGFAKDAAQNMALLRGLDRVAALGFPVMVGVSRKSVIGALTAQDDPARRDMGSVAAGLWAVRQGARLLRVHDVAGHRQALSVWRALEQMG